MADDELNLLESQSGDEAEKPPEGEELDESAVLRARVAELETLVAQKDEELGKANARIVEFEQVVAESEEKLTSIDRSLAEAVTSYKALAVQSNPGVLEELITGESIEAIDLSLERAKTLVNKVRQGLEAEISLARVPAGAPERIPPDLSALSPREKIQYAIGGKQ